VVRGPWSRSVPQAKGAKDAKGVEDLLFFAFWFSGGPWSSACPLSSVLRSLFRLARSRAISAFCFLLLLWSPSW
jgi:hypothetical protein